MKKKNSSKKGAFGRTYTAFVLLLLFAIAAGLAFVWRECKKYQESSASTLVAGEMKRLSEETGLDFECSMIPKKDKDGNYDYCLTIDGKNCAAVTLKQTSSGIMNLALFECCGTKCLSDIKIVCEETAEIKAGGRILSGDDGEDYRFELFDALNENGFDMPEYKQYSAEGIYGIAQVSASREGRDLKLVPLDENTWLACEEMPPGTVSEIRERTAEMVDVYSKYISEDASFAALSSYICGGSPLYARFGSMDISWYTEHIAAEVTELKMSDPVEIEDGRAIISTSYKYVLTRYENVVTIPTELTMVIELGSDGYWRIAELSPSLMFDFGLTDQEPFAY